MSIERTQKITPAALPASGQKGATRADRGAAARASGATRVSLHQPLQAMAADASQDIDYARLERIKTALAAGELPIDNDKISHALVRDMLTF